MILILLAFLPPALAVACIFSRYEQVSFGRVFLRGTLLWAAAVVIFIIGLGLYEALNFHKASTALSIAAWGALVLAGVLQPPTRLLIKSWWG